MSELTHELKQDDQGAHYRFGYKVKLTEKDIENGYVVIKLDPFRIAKIYNMTSFALMTVLKKILCAGSRGYKDYRQDLNDCICALDREIEMLEEDK